MKSALFVDFDNVYSGLRKMDPAMAERFARQPLEWVNWLGSSLALPDHSREGARRRLLVRRCYLNPDVYQRFRPSFNRAGFEIVDCPPMTSEGKTSTDIHMVLDIMDLLQHEAHYDEFIVFSADADFAPVLRKLRRWDRRTTVLAIGFPSAAYQASADLLIEPELFVRQALGFEDEEEPAPRPPLQSALVKKAADTAIASKAPATKTLMEELLATAAKFIRHAVADSPRAVALPWLAQQLADGVPELKGSKWAGAGTFKNLIDKLSLTPLAVDWDGGGHVWDPRRHTTPQRDAAAAEPAWGGDKGLAALARQVHDATGMPLLTPSEYTTLFNAIATEVAERPFQLNETAKRVRDRCRAAGEAISRADVNFVLQGLVFSGHEFGKGDDTPALLAQRSGENVMGLCRREQLQVDESMAAAITRWISSSEPVDN